MISYKPMLIRMVELDISKTKMKDDLGLSSTTVSKISKNMPLSLETIEKICIYLDCEIEDVVKIIK